MTVITRSKSKLINNTTNIINDNHIATPKLSRYSKKIYPGFKDVLANSTIHKKIVDKYPLNYKGFNITDETQKIKVDKYLDMVDTFIKDDKKKKSYQSVKEYKEQLENISDDEFFELAKSLIKNPKMHQIYEKANENGTMNKTIESWALLTDATITAGLLNVLIKYNDIERNEIDQCKYIINKTIPYLTTFKDIIMSNAYATFGSTRRFLGTVLRQMLKLSDDGILHCALIIGYYYPEMLTKECHPYINKVKRKSLFDNSNTDAYNSTDPIIQELYKKSIQFYM